MRLAYGNTFLQPFWKNLSQRYLYFTSSVMGYSINASRIQLWRDIEINRAIWDGIIPQFSGWILFLSWSLSFSLSLLHAHMHIIYTRYICEVRRAVNILNCNITYFRCFIISSSINYILWKWLDWRQKRKGGSQLKFKTVLWIMVVLIFWIPSNLPFSSVT